MINHTEITYGEMPFNETTDILTSAIADSDLSKVEQAEAKKMMTGFAEMMTPNVSVREARETQKIKDWNCKKYIMAMSMMRTTTTIEVWATEDTKIDYELYSTLMFSMMSKTPGLEKMLDEIKKSKG